MARWLRGEGVAIMRSMTTSCGIAMCQQSEGLGGLWKELKEKIDDRIFMAKVYRADPRLRKIQNGHIWDAVGHTVRIVVTSIVVYYYASIVMKDENTYPYPVTSSSHSAPTQSTPATASPAKPACECAPKQ